MPRANVQGAQDRTQLEKFILSYSTSPERTIVVDNRVSMTVPVTIKHENEGVTGAEC
jgi:hypothetical protein